jgi:hypothetical protein
LTEQRARALRRCVGLRRKAADAACTPQEAENLRAMADRIAEREDFTDVEVDGFREATGRFGALPVWEGPADGWVIWAIAPAVATFWEVEFLTYRPESGQAVGLSIYGEAEDVAKAAFAFASLCRSFEAAWAEHQSAGCSYRFREGYIEGLSQGFLAGELSRRSRERAAGVPMRASVPTTLPSVRDESGRDRRVDTLQGLDKTPVRRPTAPVPLGVWLAGFTKGQTIRVMIPLMTEEVRARIEGKIT